MHSLLHSIVAGSTEVLEESCFAPAAICEGRERGGKPILGT